MRKEVYIAVFAGILLGAAIGFGVWRANIAFNPQGSSEVSQNSDTTEIQETLNGVDLAISEPSSQAVFTVSETLIKGLTKPGNTVVISAEDEDFVIESGEDGTFEQSIELVGGLNQILIASINGSGARSNHELILIYSSEFEEQN